MPACENVIITPYITTSQNAYFYSSDYSCFFRLTIVRRKKDYSYT